MSGTRTDKYNAAVRNMERFTLLKEQRNAGLKRLWRSQGHDEHTIEFWLDKDPELGWLAAKAARWAGMAAAYGPGAALESAPGSAVMQ